MREQPGRKSANLMCAGIALALLGAATGAAAHDDPGLRARVRNLEGQLAATNRRLDDAETKAEQTADDGNDSLLKWHLSGFATFNYIATDAPGMNDQFGEASFSPVFHFQYDDWILFESELEFTLNDMGETEFALEYAQANLLLHDSLTFAVGQFLSPVGQFTERLHPSWINKLPDAPAGFGHGGIQPMSDLGIMVRGGIPIGENGTVVYSVAAGNGPRIGHHGPELEAFASDDNGNKAVSGRVGIRPAPFAEVGVSFLTARITGEDGAPGPDGPATSATFRIWGVDAAFTQGFWDFRGEYLNADLGSIVTFMDGAGMTELVPATSWTAWYVQLAYQLAGITDAPFLRNLEPVVRHGEFKGAGFDEFLEGSEQRTNVGLNYLFTPSVIGKASVEWRRFPDGTRETRYLLQFADGF